VKVYFGRNTGFIPKQHLKHLRRDVKKKKSNFLPITILNWIILSLYILKVRNFANPKRVYLLNRLRNGYARPESILNYSFIYEVLRKSYLYKFFLGIDIFKSKVSYDLDDNWLNYGTFVSSGHLEFLRHFQNSYFFFLWSKITKLCHSTNFNAKSARNSFSYNCSSITINLPCLQ
jgi:hypothetical protein